MPRGANIAEFRALNRAKKEANRVKKHEQGLNMNISRWQSSPLDLSEPHVNTDFLDIPCTPVATTAEPNNKPQVAPHRSGGASFLLESSVLGFTIIDGLIQERC